MSKRKDKLRKANEVIQISGNWTLVERKLFNALLFLAFKDLGKKRKHVVEKKRLSALAGISDRNTERLMQRLENLTKIGVHWNLLDEKEQGVYSLLAGAKLKRGKIEYDFSIFFEEHIRLSQTFTYLFLSIQRKFKVKFSLNLYENLKRFEKVNSSGWIPIDKFRKLIGADSPYYDQYKNLNRQVIKVAVNEINAYSDIHITPEIEKDGHKVKAIRFEIKQNEQFPLYKFADTKALREAAKKCYARNVCPGTPWKIHKQHEDRECYHCPRFDEQRKASDFA